MKLTIAVEDGRSTHELADERITIGRAPDNSIQLAEPSVSGRHAQLDLVGERYRLRDLDSTNGTWVNGETVTDVFLRAGDRIHFGKVEARYESDAMEELPPFPEANVVGARPAETSEKPADFANASPFASRTKEKDPLATACYAAAAVAIVAFLLSMLNLLRLHAPM